MEAGKIVKVSGPLVVAGGMQAAKMYDVVRVGPLRLIGEVIELRGEFASIQVYEETAGLGPGEPVYLTGEPLSVELGPGLIQSVYDGIQRPLEVIRAKAGYRIARGVDAPALDREKKWEFVPRVKAGDKVVAGDVLGTVSETSLVEHRVLVPPGAAGVVEEIRAGKHTVEDVVARIRQEGGPVEIKLYQRWPVRTARPVKEKLMPEVPLVTGQRVIDTLFPLAKGGTACIPGPFGAGKTVAQHQFAKWADVDIIVYIGCGERGNEICDVLTEFPRLLDPRNGEPLLKRTVLIANTSNMPVAARDASVYTGITIAEYFRDMGYSVALMADSTSRWAEAMREISGRLEEMPGEEGYPAYLSSRIAEFYERAGRVVCLGGDGREGSLSVVGAVSPPGGDLSDPVVQATLRVVKVFWGLDDHLANIRHFPAINWLLSYSLYQDNLNGYYRENLAPDWVELRQEAMKLLQEEAELAEIARLVGVEALSARDRLTLETARSLREDLLHQNAFHEVDTHTSLTKQYRMLRVILKLYEEARQALEKQVPLEDILKLKIWEEIARMKYVPEDKQIELEQLEKRVREAIREKITKVVEEVKYRD